MKSWVVVVTVGLLDAAGGGGTLASGLGGELLAGSLASGGLAGGLLGTGHFDDVVLTSMNELCRLVACWWNGGETAKSAGPGLVQNARRFYERS